MITIILLSVRIPNALLYRSRRNHKCARYILRSLFLDRSRRCERNCFFTCRSWPRGDIFSDKKSITYFPKYYIKLLILPYSISTKEPYPCTYIYIYIYLVTPTDTNFSLSLPPKIPLINTSSFFFFTPCTHTLAFLYPNYDLSKSRVASLRLATNDFCLPYGECGEKRPRERERERMEINT